MYFDKVYFDENNNPTELQIICNKCGKILYINNVNKFQIIKSDYCVLKEGQLISCTECNNIGQGMIEYKKNANINDCIVHKVSDGSINKPKCPYCNSTNLSKIGTVGPSVSVGLFGLASSKIGKQFHCNNCGANY